jgi:hypothetical protein
MPYSLVPWWVFLAEDIDGCAGACAVQVASFELLASLPELEA